MIKRLAGIFLVLSLLAASVPVVLKLWIDRHYRSLVYGGVEEVPERPVAIVLGAGVYPDGRLTPVLQDRVEMAIGLYRAGKVQRLLFTGDNRYDHYNEPQRMFAYAVARGVPPEAIVLDYAGRRTYDSCYRARAIFQVGRAIIITQRFHQPRALFLCDRLGLDAIGLAADRRVYSRDSMTWWRAREIPATLLAWWEVNVSHPIPVLGDPLPIRVETSAN